MPAKSRGTARSNCYTPMSVRFTLPTLLLQFLLGEQVAEQHAGQITLA